MWYCVCFTVYYFESDSHSLNVFFSYQKISSLPNLLPIRKELIDLLYHSCELETSGVEQGLATTLMSIQLGRHESRIDQLLKQSTLLMETVHHLQSVMTLHSVPIPINVGVQCKELTERQRLLRAQVLAEKQMPLLSKQIQVHLSFIVRVFNYILYMHVQYVLLY